MECLVVVENMRCSCIGCSDTVQAKRKRLVRCNWRGLMGLRGVLWLFVCSEDSQSVSVELSVFWSVFQFFTSVRVHLPQACNPPLFFFPYLESIVKHRAGLLCVDRRHPRWPHAIQLEALMVLCVCVVY